MDKTRLSATKVKSLKAPGMYSDGDGLYLQVTSSGAKSWIYRFALNKRRRDMGLGPLKALSLSEARVKRNEQAKILHQGIDPIEHRNQLRAEMAGAKAKANRRNVTFKQCAEQFIDTKKAEWKNPKHKQQWDNTLRDYAYPTIGSMKVADVDQRAILKCLKPIWTEKTETATRVRQRIEAVLDYGKAKGYREGDNPAIWKGGLKTLLPDPTKLRKVQHHDALPYSDLPSFIVELKQANGIAASALLLTILTAARTSEVLNAEWSEIDLDAKVWTIPAERMKADKEHRIPLSKAAISLLKGLPRLENYLFPGAKEGRPLSNVAMLKVLERMEYADITVHGFRSTFRDWVAEKTNYPARVAETALAHQLTDKAEKAYQRGDLLKKREQMMESWADYCHSSKAKVVSIRA